MSREHDIIRDVLIPEARAAQKDILPMAESLALALELYYTCFMMNKDERPGGLKVADRFASRMGLIPHTVCDLALDRVKNAVAEAERE